jgi:hypothetical protein
MKKLFTIAALVLSASGLAGDAAKAQNRPPDPVLPPMTAKQLSLTDLTGYWVSIVDEDWRWRMLTPRKGDYASVPLNADGRKAADTWDLAKDEAEGNQCRAYGAAGLMRAPTRLHVTWADDNTLQVDADAGTQTRLFHFDGSKWKGGEPTWQGDSTAKWEKQIQARGFEPRFAGPTPGKGGTLHVVTTHMRSGYYRKNGVPYSENATLIEYFDRVETDSQSYLILTTVVQDPKFLADQFITSEQFAREPDGSKWHPTPCTTDKPVR